MLSMQKNTHGFTFVELIIVLVIIAILATIGFVSYESYLSVGRDTAKISLMRDMNTSFSTYWLTSKIPLPENKVDITASWSVFAYQWDFTEATANIIGLKWKPFDDALDIYPTYMLSTNRKDTQILHFLEDRQSTQTAFVDQTYASTDYQILYPKVVGKALWIIIESESQEPLHLIEFVSWSWTYDVINGTESLRIYYSQDEYFEDNISRIIPDKSCKRILELWGSKGSWVYTINPTGSNKVRVYCDMETEWGWWNVVVNNDNKDDEFIATSDNTCYPRLTWYASYSCWSIDQSSDFVVNAEGVEFNELIWAVYESQFTNIKTYRYLEWSDTQVIPDTSIMQIVPADNDLRILERRQDLNLIYCWWSLTDARYIETGTPANGTFPHDPATIIWSTSYNTGKIWFTDAWSDWWIRSSYWFDDFQDGQSCWDSYSDKAYKWYSSYIMIR